MIGLCRLDHLRICIEGVLKRGVPGDLIETGLWRGGTTMRAALAAYGDRQRTVLVADSFEGLPPPDTNTYPEDAGDRYYEADYLRVSIYEVRRNFETYGLLDHQVRFLERWFRDTLSTAPIEHLAIVRLDGDMYESTWDALTSRYPKVSQGGYAILDDYYVEPGGRRAVTDYGDQFDIQDAIDPIPNDRAGAYRRRS